MSDSISREKVLLYIDRILTSGTGKNKSFEFIRKYVEQLPSAQLDPCDVCAHKDDCGDMRIYCPAERRTDDCQ